MAFDVAISIGALTSSSFAISGGAPIALGHPYAGPLAIGRYTFGNEQTLLLDDGLRPNGGQPPKRIHICVGDQLGPYWSLLRSHENRNGAVHLRIGFNAVHGYQFGQMIDGVAPPAWLEDPGPLRLLHFAAILKQHVDRASRHLRRGNAELSALVAVTSDFWSLSPGEIQSALRAAKLSRACFVDRTIAAIIGTMNEPDIDALLAATNGHIPPAPPSHPYPYPFDVAYENSVHFPIVVDVDGFAPWLKLLDFPAAAHQIVGCCQRACFQVCQTCRQCSERPRLSFAGQLLAMPPRVSVCSSNAIRPRSGNSPTRPDSLSLKNIGGIASRLRRMIAPEYSFIETDPKQNRDYINILAADPHYLVYDSVEDQSRAIQWLGQILAAARGRNAGYMLSEYVEADLSAGLNKMAVIDLTNEQQNLVGRVYSASQLPTGHFMEALRGGEVEYLPPRLWQ